MTGRTATAALVLSLALSAPAAGGEAAIPAHPKELRFAPLTFNLADPAALRHQLRSGVVVYVAEDHTFPLVDVTVQARIGAFLDPPGKDGLAALTGSLLRQGGTRRLPAEAFDDAVETLAADLTVDTEDTRSTVTLNCLSADLDSGLELLFDMLAHPVFAADRLETEKAHLGEAMATRNDTAAEVLDREWQWLLYGNEHVSSRYLTPKRLAALGRQDLIDFHARFWRPANLFVTVAGDVDTRKVLERLGALFGAWPEPGRPAPWPPAPSSFRPRPGVYARNLDVPQTQVVIGHLGLVWDGHWSDPERYAVEVLTEVLAGDLFTSRLGRRLRGAESLVYGLQSKSGISATWPDSFQIRFACDPAQVGRTLAAADEEIRRLRDEPVSADELARAKSALVAELTSSFAAPRETVVTYAGDDLLGWPHDFWRDYRERLMAVSAEDVRKMARQYLRPEEMVTLVVGNWPQRPRGVRTLPSRDPLSLEPVN